MSSFSRLQTPQQWMSLYVNAMCACGIAFSSLIPRRGGAWPHWRLLVCTGPGPVHTPTWSVRLRVALHSCQLDGIFLFSVFTLWWVNWFPVLICTFRSLMTLRMFYLIFTDQFCFPFGEFLIYVTCTLISLSHFQECFS